MTTISPKTLRWMILTAAAVLVASSGLGGFCYLHPDRCGFQAAPRQTPRVVGGYYPSPGEIDLSALAKVQANPELSERLKSLLVAAMATVRAETAGAQTSPERAGRIAQAVAEADRIEDPEVRAMALTGIALACVGQDDPQSAAAIAEREITPNKAAGAPPEERIETRSVELILDRMNPDAAELPAKTRAALDELILQINQSLASSRVELVGYTDDRGSADEIMGRSKHHAQAVYNYLIASGITEERIKGTAAGADDLVAANTSAAGRAKNNRVKITASLDRSVLVPAQPGEVPKDANAKWRALIYKTIADDYAPKDIGFAFSPAVTLTLGAIADAAGAGNTKTARGIADAFAANPQMHWFGYATTILASINRVSPLELADIAHEMPMLKLGNLISGMLAYINNQNTGYLGKELAAVQAAVLSMDPSPVQQHLLALTAGATAYADPAQVTPIVERIETPMIRDYALTGAAIQAIGKGDAETAVASLGRLSNSATRNLYFTMVAAGGLAIESNRITQEHGDLGKLMTDAVTIKVLERSGARGTLDLIHAGLALGSFADIKGLPGGPASLNDITDPGLRAVLDKAMRIAEFSKRNDSRGLIEEVIKGSDAEQLRTLLLTAGLLSTVTLNNDPVAWQADALNALIGIGNTAPSPNALALLSRALAGENGLTHFLDGLTNDQLRDYLVALLVPVIVRGGFLEGQTTQIEWILGYHTEHREDLGKLIDKIGDPQLRDFALSIFLPVDIMRRLNSAEDTETSVKIARDALAKVSDPLLQDAVRQQLAISVYSWLASTPNAPASDFRIQPSQFAWQMVEDIALAPMRDMTIAIIVPTAAAAGLPLTPTELTEHLSGIADPMIRATAFAELAFAITDRDRAQAHEWINQALSVAHGADPMVRDEVLAALVALAGEGGAQTRGIAIAREIEDPAKRAAALVVMGGESARQEVAGLLPGLEPRERAGVLYLMEIERIPSAELGPKSPAREDLGNGRKLYVLPRLIGQ